MITRNLYYINDPFWNMYYNTNDDIFGRKYINQGNIIPYVKIGNIKDPFEFEFKKKYGYISKNSIRCSNGDIVQILS